MSASLGRLAISALLVLGASAAWPAPARGALPCPIRLAASDGVFSLVRTVVVPNEPYMLRGSGWIPNAKVQIKVRNFRNGYQDDFELTADATGAISWTSSFDTTASGPYFHLAGQNEGTPEFCGIEALLWVAPAIDIRGQRFERDIKWLYREEITFGCERLRYCGSANATRGQVAALLARAFNLPDTTRDFFTDDDGSRHENAINRLRLAGISHGCAAHMFCPSGLVTRAQMATFISRALHLDRGIHVPVDDYFTDDDGSRHEDEINLIRAAGITSGCGGRSYCPDRVMSRAHVAAFINRARD